MPPRILLLGGIGSGKSTAAAWFSDHGAVVLSSDLVARGVLDPGTDATRQVLARWPSVGDDGEIDRAALGRVVFGDPSALAELESIVHPATRAGLQAEIGRYPDRAVVVEMPILRDWLGRGWVRVVVDAPDEVRVQRAIERDPSTTQDDVRRVMGHQPTRGEWLAAADYVVDNAGDETSMTQDCARVWERLRTD